MINKNSLSAEWINKISKKHRKTDKILIEKTIRALFLLEQLKLNDLNFIFKGGTSLVLLLDEIKRLSIDIDIIIPEKSDLSTILDKIISTTDFIRWELNNRQSKSKIEKAHYKFYYYPSTNTRGDEEYILLDILFESNPYHDAICEKEITSSLLSMNSEPLKVTMPKIDAILGDKLTAFAPNTTGIPYGIGKEVEIIKQMYDVGCLVYYATDVSIVSEVFNNIAKTELKYRKLKGLTSNHILDDIFQTSLCISLRGQDGDGKFKELQKGIQSIMRFITSELFHIEKAITFASKAAYISSLIKMGKKEIIKFTSPVEIKEWVIEQPFNTKLNKLKKSNPEAFYYWYQAINLIKK